MKRSVLASLAVIVVLVGTAIAGKPGPATKVVKAANDTISTQLEQKVTPGSPEEKALAAKVTASVRDFIDIDELGKRALVDHWDKLKPAEQQEYLSVLRSLIESNYIKGLQSNLSYTVDYTGENTDDKGNIVVTTEIKTKRKGRPLKIAVDYVLVKDAKGKLRAFDVRTDGVGLVENYRAQFNKIIDKGGIAELIAKMKKKQAAAAAPPAAPAPTPAPAPPTATAPAAKTGT